MADIFEQKLRGNPLPGSQARAVFFDGHAALGYIFMPEGTPDGDEPADVCLDGWIHFPRLEAGDGTNAPHREKLEDFLQQEHVESVAITGHPDLGGELEWQPGCPDCGAVGEGEVWVEKYPPNPYWHCALCDARIEEPLRLAVPTSQKVITKTRTPDG